MTDVSQQVIFTTSDPPLVMTFDSAMGLHTVWTLRYAAAEVSTTRWLQGWISQRLVMHRNSTYDG